MFARDRHKNMAVKKSVFVLKCSKYEPYFDQCMSLTVTGSSKKAGIDINYSFVAVWPWYIETLIKIHNCMN